VIGSARALAGKITSTANVAINSHFGNFMIRSSFSNLGWCFDSGLKPQLESVKNNSQTGLMNQKEVFSLLDFDKNFVKQ
jgi:hypothetical protein